MTVIDWSIAGGSNPYPGGKWSSGQEVRRPHASCDPTDCPTPYIGSVSSISVCCGDEPHIVDCIASSESDNRLCVRLHRLFFREYFSPKTSALNVYLQETVRESLSC